MGSPYRKVLTTQEKSGLDRRTYLSIITALGGTTLAGCIGSPSDEGSTDTEGKSPTETASSIPSSDQMGGTLQVSLESTISTLDAHKSALQITNVALENITQKLFRVGRDLKPRAELAKELEISDDGLTWTITLQEGVMWHPPYKREMTAEDVVYNFDRIYDVGSFWTINLDLIDEYTAVDDYTLELKFNKVSASQKAWLDHKGMELMSPDAIEDGVNPKEEVIGTGPFKFEEWVTGTKFVISAFDDYWETDEEGNALPYIDKVEMRPIKESSVKVTELQTGNIDMVRVPPRTKVPDLQEDKNLEVDIKQTGGWQAFHLNTGDEPTEGRGPEKPFTNRKVRKAAAAALDWDMIVETVNNGYARRSQNFYPKESQWHLDYEPYDYSANPEKAKKLIEEAGFSTPLEVRIISTTESDILKDAARVAQSNWNNAGFDAVLNEYEIGTWVKKLLNHNYDMSPNAVQLFDDPDKFRINLGPNTPVQPLGDSPQNNNSEKYFELFKQARQTLDQEERKSIYDELQRTVVDDATMLFLSHPKVIQAYRTAVKNYETHPFKIAFPLERAYLDRS